MAYPERPPRSRRGRAFVTLAVAALLLLPAAAHAQRGWGGPETVSGIQTGMSWPALAVDDGGTVTAAWREGAGPTYQVRAARRGADGPWSAAVTVGTPSFGADIAVAAAPSGGAIVLWTAGDAGVYASRFLPATGTWTPDTVVAPRPTQYAHLPALAVDGAGNAIAVWYLDGIERIEAVRYDAASHTWGPVVTLGNGVGPMVDMDAAGNAVTVWTDRSGPLDAIRAARFSAGTSLWNAALTLDSNAFLVALDLDVAADGTAATLWYDEDSPRTQSALSVALLSPGSGLWGAPAVLSTSSPSGVVAVGSHEAMAIWTTGQGAVASRTDLAAAPGTWTAAAPVDASLSGPSGLFMSLAADGLGHFVAAWTVGGSGRASHYSRTTTAWEPSVLLSTPGVSARGPTTVMTASGTATVAWTGEVWPYQAVQAMPWEGTLAAPVVSAVVPGPGSLAVSFAVAPGLGLPAFAPTNVEYSTDGGFIWSPRAPASIASPLVITGLTDFTAYALRLRVVNAAGAGPASTSALSTPGAGSTAPVGLTVSDIEGDLVTLTWDRPVVGTAPEQYIVEGGVAPGQTLVSIPTATAMPVFSVRLPAGTYFVRVRAVALQTTSAPSNEVRVTHGATTPPSAPAHLLGLVNGSGLALSWTNTFLGGRPDQLWLVVSGPVSGMVTLGWAETFQYGAVPSGTYTFQLVATNAAGVSPPSNPVTLTFPGACSGVPGSPLRVRATVSGTTITLRWSPPEAGAALTRYRILVGTPGDTTRDAAGVARRPLYGFTVHTPLRRISGTVPRDYYTFFVSAENACGSGPSAAPVSVWVR